MRKHLVFICYLTLTIPCLQAQSSYDFEHFQTIESKGNVPEDFSEPTLQKIEQGKLHSNPDFNKIQNIKFNKEVNYGIDQILKSGRVTYGDAISLYVKKVAEKITKNNPEFSNMRYYLIQSNIVNAFSTEQGIVFITEGMMAKLENEAQLAAILAHELAHFSRHHIAQSFIENLAANHQYLDYNVRIEKINQFSRLKEFEADELGLQMYHDAGYSKDEIFPTFDILAYSHLPYENRPFPIDYFNTDKLFVPQYLFKKKCPNIAANLISDDESSHPTIAARKEHLATYIDKYTNWKNNIYLTSEEVFIDIRTIARFESIKNDLSSQQYRNALYTIFLLEKDFPNNLFLSQCKAQAWAGLAAFKMDNKVTPPEKDPETIQGEAYELHHFICELSVNQLLTLSLRITYDLTKKYPQDIELKAIQSYLLSQIAQNSDFSWSDYSDETFQNEMNKINKKDSLRKVDLENKFQLYALSDMKNDSVIITEWKSIKNNLPIANESPTKSHSLRKNKQLAKQRLSIGLEKIIFVEPTAIQLQKDKVDLESSNKLEQRLTNCVNTTAQEVNLDSKAINSSDLDEIGTQGYNDKSILLKAIYQLSKYDNMSLFPVDYMKIQNLIKRNGTGKLGFLFLKNTYRPLRLKSIAIGMIVPPLGLMALTTGILNLNSVALTLMVFDLNNLKIDVKEIVTFSSRPGKRRLGNHLHDLFYQLQQKPIK